MIPVLGRLRQDYCNADISLEYQKNQKIQDRWRSSPTVTSKGSDRANVRICRVTMFGWLHLTVSNSLRAQSEALECPECHLL